MYHASNSHHRLIVAATVLIHARASAAVCQACHMRLRFGRVAESLSARGDVDQRFRLPSDYRPFSAAPPMPASMVAMGRRKEEEDGAMAVVVDGSAGLIHFLA